MGTNHSFETKSEENKAGGGKLMSLTININTPKEGTQRSEFNNRVHGNYCAPRKTASTSHQADQQ